MKKSLIFALSMVVGMANASVVEFVNTSKHKIQGTMLTVGAGLCGEKITKVVIEPQSTKIIDAKNCCVHSLKLGVRRDKLKPEEGLTVKSLEKAISAHRMDNYLSPMVYKYYAVWGKTATEEAQTAALVLGGGLSIVTLGVSAAVAGAGYGGAQIRLCGTKEKFEIKVYDQYKKMTIENITGK